MPNRNNALDAIVLRLKEMPNGDRLAVLLTRQQGIVEAFVHGGPKSKLRSLASPYNLGTAYVYHDPVRDTRKLSDFSAESGFPSIRENLAKLSIAAFIAEIALKTSSNEYDAEYGLVATAFDQLERCSGRNTSYIAIQFVWRLLDIMGLRPDPRVCASCGRERENKIHWYSRSAGSFVCVDCSETDFRESGPRLVEAPAAVLRYLEASSELDFAAALRIGVEDRALPALKAIAFAAASKAAEGPLKTLSRGDFLA